MTNNWLRKEVLFFLSEKCLVASTAIGYQWSALRVKRLLLENTVNTAALPIR